MIVRLLALSPALLVPAAAYAHHMEDGRLPATLASGLLSGLGHPIIGWDHLAFVVGAGILVAAWDRGPAAVAAFVLGTLGGCLVHLARIDLPAAEAAVGLSLLALAAAIAWRARAGAGTGGAGMVAALGLAGLVHGYAYGESIVGAEPTPVVAYLVGFATVQAVIGIGTWWTWRRIAALRPRWEQAAAAIVGAAGLAALFA